ncbi:MAG: ABC transporter permease [Opitutaceae bacterium]
MKLLRKILALFRRERLEADMAEEMREHLERRVDANLAAGMTAEEARYAARRQFGGAEQLKEAAREERSWVWLEQFVRDLRFALRSLLKAPGFTAVTLLTLALGMGATTAIFTVANALLLRPLPGQQPEQLVVVAMPFRRPGTAQPISLRLYEQFRARTRSLSDLCLISAYGSVRPLVAPGATAPEFVQVEFVSGNFFSVLGSPATLGRTLLPDDDRRGQPQAVVVLSHGFWQRQFGSDPTIIGKAVQIEKILFTVVGVAARGFFGIEFGDVWCPLHAAPLLDPEQPPPGEDEELGLPIGRLRPGASRAQAQAELDVIFQQDLARLAAGKNLNDPRMREQFVGRTLKVLSGTSGVRLGYSPRDQSLVFLLAAVGVVLLVACCNVAGLSLARNAWRQRELAVRAALGASRSRLVRLLLGESLLLTLIGGGAGLLVAQWGTTWLAAYLPVTGDGLDLTPDVRVLGFSLLLTLGTGIACGLLPAWQSSRVDLTTATKNQSHTLSGRSSQTLNRAVVVAQIALSFALLTVAGLLTRSLQNLRTIDTGFPRENLTLFTVDLGREYAGPRGAALYQSILTELETLPGVRAATMATSELLVSRGGQARVNVPGYVAESDELPGARFFAVGPRFFATLGLPLRVGRDFNARDFAARTTEAAVINETMAREFFGEANPLGRTFKWGRRTFEIVGVAQDTRAYDDVYLDTLRIFYVPFLGGDPDEMQTMQFDVRTAHHAAIASSIHELVRRLAPEARLRDLTTASAAVEQVLVRERALAQLSGFFSAFALFLVGLGLYGLLAQGVARRTHEIGVRMALGAQVRDVVSLILKQGVGLVLVGGGLGLAGAIGITRLLGGFLYGIAPNDPLALAVAAAALLAIALLACWLPARRATKVDPMVALRSE